MDGGAGGKEREQCNFNNYYNDYTNNNNTWGSSATKISNLSSLFRISQKIKRFRQCLGSGSGSVGSARFWLPGSGFAKICGSTDPDPRGKISTKNCKKKKFYSQNPNPNYWKNYKNFLISEWFIKFYHKNKRK